MDRDVAVGGPVVVADHRRADELVGLVALVGRRDGLRGARGAAGPRRGRSRRRRAWSAPSACRGPSRSSARSRSRRGPRGGASARAPRRRPGAEVGSVSRPSVNACTTRSGTPSCAASSISASMWVQPECTPPSETRPIRCRRPRGLFARRRAGGEQDLVLEQRAVGDRVVDPRQVLLDDRARAEVHVADLGVAHLPVGEADVAPAGRERRVRVALPELVEHRRLGERDGVARALLGEAPAVEDHEAERGRPAATRGRRGSRACGRADRGEVGRSRATRRRPGRRRSPAARRARRRSRGFTEPP